MIQIPVAIGEVTDKITILELKLRYITDKKKTVNIEKELILLKEIFNDGMFNNYRIYNYLALYISKTTENYNYYLSIINIVLSSITFGVIYLILAEVGTSLLLRNITTVFILLYIPISAIDTFLRVDVLYFFLLTTSIYLSISF